ncbi:MAG: heat-inducible transcription repressor HrcA [Ruminococcaceae bacterium]|nr:heat-inducible transcription repressor HrcA [Oscillospiraceae bacterium]
MAPTDGIRLDPKQRRLAILAAIIESYAESGEPVASGAVARMLGGSVSSATLRNDMASLAQGGYLFQPHTSSGRIPTERGYRMYVDRLMTCRTLPEDVMRHIDIQLTACSMDPERFFAETARMLSGMTHMTAALTHPVSKDARVLGVELMPTGRHTCLLMVMISPSMLRTRLCRLDVELTDNALDIMRRILRTAVCGRHISEINHRLVARVKEQLGDAAEAVEPLLLAVRDIVRSGESAQVAMGGQEHLLEHSAFSDGALRDMLAFLSDREQLSALMRGSPSTINVFIGSESGRQELREASIITAQYSTGAGATGWIGLIGPQRMSYSRLIPCLQYFSDAVGRLLSAMEAEEI